jgi:hypothetical protein
MAEMINFTQYIVLESIELDQLDEVAMVDNVKSKSSKLGLGNVLRTTNPHGDEKLHSSTATHHIYRMSQPGLTRYVARDKQSGQAHVVVQGLERNNVMHIRTTAAHDQSTVKAHDVYHHLIKQGKTLASDSKQSEGGKRIWQKLAKIRGVNVHGWHKGKAVNVKMGDDETHTEPGDDSYGYGAVKNMILVAHKK